MSSNPARKYCTPIEGKANGFVCNFCGHEMKGRGVTRVKNHLAATDNRRSTTVCDKCPPEVREEMRECLFAVSDKKKSKSIGAYFQSKTTKGLRRYESDEENDGEEVLVQSTMKRVRQQEAADQWRAEREGPGGSSAEPRLQRSSSLAPSLYKSPSSRQQRVDVMSIPGYAMKLGRNICKFFVHEHIPASKADSHHFRNMMQSAQEFGK